MTRENDPCDQMVTIEQVVSVLTARMSPTWPTVDKFYDRVGAILGIDRNEAKRLIDRSMYR